jgi:hypothetical protein
MLVRMLVGLSGPAYLLQPGDKKDFPRDEALRLVEARYAVPVADHKIERAVAVPVTEKRGRKRRVVSGNDNDGGN